MIETTQSIADWAEETFGPAPSLARIVARANEEMAELITEMLSPQKMMSDRFVEAADIAIVLCRIAPRFGVDVKESCHHVSTNTTAELIVAKANQAMAALLRHVTSGRDDALISATLQVLIEWLVVFCNMHRDYDLWSSVERKMTINRARAWQTDGTGHGYHVRQKEGDAA